ncbi:hypothetical protein ElyMa_001840200 [Elysia marginata]|uniref:Uncharacterized protein n=1 Tax=Elysia marginata TaxID=1093978 RepID=A0AAV4EKS7_9GAST|nr:hypothetical protein ElyMa_001840200 [Elysia marginata]
MAARGMSNGVNICLDEFDHCASRKREGKRRTRKAQEVSSYFSIAESMRETWAEWTDWTLKSIFADRSIINGQFEGGKARLVRGERSASQTLSSHWSLTGWPQGVESCHVICLLAITGITEASRIFV